MQANTFFLAHKNSYGPGKQGIERLDLLVGNMYEGKVHPSFAISETSFMVFVLMATRRLDADPFLNEFYNEETYSKFGLKHVKKTKGLIELLDRHYPDMTVDFKDKNGKYKQSAFKPTLTDKDWEKAIKDNIVPEKYTDEWATTKACNKEFFDGLEKETKIFTKNLKADSKEITVFNPEEYNLTVILPETNKSSILESSNDEYSEELEKETKILTRNIMADLKETTVFNPEEDNLTITWPENFQTVTPPLLKSFLQGRSSNIN